MELNRNGVAGGARETIPAKPSRASPITNAGRIAGAVGAVLLLTSPITWMLTEQFGLYFWGKLIVGGLLVGFYLLTNADFFSRLAGSRSFTLWAMTIASTAVVIGIVVVVNYVVLHNDHEFDLTREGLYTLSPQTRGVIERLDEEVKIIAFFASYESDLPVVEEALARYARASDKLTYEIVDPQERPDLVEKHGITDRGPRMVILAGEREARAKDESELELTNAIIRVAEQTSKTIAFLTGHGEPDLDDDVNAEGFAKVAELIRAEGYQVRELSLLRAETAGQVEGIIRIEEARQPARDVASEQAVSNPPDNAAANPSGEIVTEQGVSDPPAGAAANPASDGATGHPDDAAGGIVIPAEVTVLVVAGARSMLFQPELDALDRYLDRGGRVIVLLEPDMNTGLEPLLSKWKLSVNKDLIVDSNIMNRLLGFGPAAPMVYAVDESHPVTKGLETAALMFTVRSVGTHKEGAPAIDAQVFLATDESAWGETNPVDGAAERGEDDNLGPVDVAATATKHIPSHVSERLADEGRLVLFGDSDWLNNRYLPIQGNADLFVNTVNWMAAEEEKISIGRKTRAASGVFFSFAQLGVLKFVALDLLWVLYVAIGFGVVLIRRQK